jgi:glycosyltransferase involved in cell wall biosynthesis
VIFNMARIRIYIARHLCTAPRPQKEAEALAAAGHDVSVHGIAYRTDFSERDAAIARGRNWRWEPVAHFAGPNRRLAWFGVRLRHRLAREWHATTGGIHGDVWGYAHTALAAHALHDPAELTIVHAEGGLAFGAELLRRGHRVGVDFEDWFSRDLTPAQRRGRPVDRLARLEENLLRRVRYATTTSAALAQAMAAATGGPAPTAVYNTFPAGAEPDISRADGRPVALHWFSQFIGPERGLETLMVALPGLAFDWELHLRGEVDPTFRRSLLQIVPPHLRVRVHFHSTIAPAALPAAVARHDIGLALEISTIPSRNLTITNKFFHYLQSGLAVVASDTDGHREGLALAPGAGLTFKAGDAASLAEAIRALASDPAVLLAARRAARAAFVQRLAQEHQAGIYARLAADALQPAH